MGTFVRRRLRSLAAVLGLGLGGLAAPAAADCPPRAQAPTPQQVQAGQREARDRGLLWRIEKAGQVGWLYGTLHVGRLAWAFPGPRIAQALASADTLALELDFGDPAMARALASAVAALQARSAASPLPAPLLARLAALARTECLDESAFARQPPLLQALALTALSARRDGLDPAFAQEASLGSLARAGGKALVSLETPAAQLAALVPDDAQALAAAVARMVEQLESGQARRLLGLAAAVWARGDLAALARYEAWCECEVTAAERAQMQRLNDARNPALADAIDALAGQGRRVFAAVGALHMTGAQALPGLMAQRGWTVQRVVLDGE
jgi:hypothetical protein